MAEFCGKALKFINIGVEGGFVSFGTDFWLLSSWSIKSWFVFFFFMI